jgi:hypothetical protein
MQQIEHALQVKSVLFPLKESECRILEYDLNRDPMTPCTNTAISYWHVVYELFSSYPNNRSSFYLHDVLTGADALETEMNNEVN